MRILFASLLMLLGVSCVLLTGFTHCTGFVLPGNILLLVVGSAIALEILKSILSSGQ